jgi:hypothetical protein|tara:strand:+ start:4741 stop:5352 length:612 start_codon:yes stop_codon:yes gene_type:complete
MAKFTTLPDSLTILEYDGRKISLSDKEGKSVRIQMPRMYMPFGMSCFTPAMGNSKWNIDFSLKGYDEDGNSVKSFYEKLLETEEAIINSVSMQSVAIFKKHMSVEELRPLFNSNLKYSPDREPKFRVKVDVSGEGVIKSGVFNSEKQCLKDDLVDKLYARNSGVGISEMCSVYFMNRKFGITWKLHQLVVHEPQQLKGFQFVL